MWRLRDPLRHSRWRVRVTSEAVLALRQLRQSTFLVQGVPMGVVRARQVITTDASLSGWGGIHEGRIVNGRWGQHLTNLHINYLEMLAVFSDVEAFSSFSQRASCSRENGKHYSWGLHKPTGRSQITSFAHVSTQTNFMEQCQSSIPESDARTRYYEQGCRSAVQGQSPLRGVEIKQGSGLTDSGHIRQSDSGSVRVPRQCSMSSIYFP